MDSACFANIHLGVSMGNGGARGLSAISVDRKSISIRADLTPVIGNGGCTITHDSIVAVTGILAVKVQFNSVRFCPAITMRNGSTDVITFGYGHWNALFAMLL